MTDHKDQDKDGRQSLGKALRQAVGYEELPPEERRRERGRTSILMNEVRQKIFQLLCDRPCSHIRFLARELDVSAPTIEWHLRKLVRNGFVNRHMVGRKKVFYPSNFVAVDDIKTMAMFNEDLPRKIIQELQRTPGLSQKDLRARVKKGALSRCLNEMKRCGILDTINSGKFIHYYIDKGLLARDKDYSGRMRQFRREVLKRFSQDGISPKLQRARENRIEIEVMSGPKKRLLVIHTRPFAFLLSEL